MKYREVYFIWSNEIMFIFEFKNIEFECNCVLEIIFSL